MKTSTKIKAGCGIVAVFGFGFVLGIVTLLVILVNVIPLSEGWKSEESKQFIADHFKKKLKLTPEQDAEFRPLVYELLERRWELRRDYLEKSRRLLEEEYLARAADILDADQRAQAGKMLARWKRDQSFKLDAWGSDPEPDSAIAADGKKEKPEEESEKLGPDAPPPPDNRVRDPGTPKN